MTQCQKLWGPLVMSSNLGSGNSWPLGRPPSRFTESSPGDPFLALAAPEYEAPTGEVVHRSLALAPRREGRLGPVSEELSHPRIPPKEEAPCCPESCLLL